MAMKCQAGLPESNHSNPDVSIITNATVNSPADELKEKKTDESAKATLPGAARYSFAGYCDRNNHRWAWLLCACSSTEHHSRAESSSHPATGPLEFSSHS
jgi:hypothetical protein